MTSRPSPAIRDTAVPAAKIAVLTAIRRRGRVGGSDAEGWPVSTVVLGVLIGAAIVRARRGRPRLLAVMANIHSQKKRILRAERERLENRRYTSKIKTYFRRLQRAVQGGDP